MRRSPLTIVSARRNADSRSAAPTTVAPNAQSSRTGSVVARMQQALCREEIDRLGGRDRFNIAILEAEQLHACDQLAFEVRVVEIARHHTAIGHLAPRRD